MAITWLIGKSSKVDILWSAYCNEIIAQPEFMRNTSLFEEKKYKYIFNKKDQNFFKQKHSRFLNEIIIKGIAKFDSLIMNDQLDVIINVDSLNRNTLFALLLKITNTKFSPEEINFTKKIENFEDFATIIILKKLNIETKFWPFFIKKIEKNWLNLFQNNSLISFGILYPSQIIPIMVYLINSKHNKRAILLFLNAKIKQGSTIWEFSKFWTSSLEL